MKTRYISLEDADKLSRPWSGDDYRRMLNNDQEKEDEELKELEEMDEEFVKPLEGDESDKD